jgi:hypothetical protein
MIRALLHLLCLGVVRGRVAWLIRSFVLVSAVVTVSSLRVRADVAFLNGWTNTVSVTGAVQFQLLPGQSFSFVPSSSATNEIEIDGLSGGDTQCLLQDGCLYAVNPDGSVSQQSVLRSTSDDDRVLAWYFTSGLECGTGTSVVLFGFLAIRRGLRLGDVMD